MTFSEILSDYMTNIPASATEISEASGLSMATISRFRNGKREPSQDSDTIEKLAQALADISGAKGEAIAKDEIYENLVSSLRTDAIDFDQIAANFNALINATGMNVSHLSHYLRFDPSYLSRIRAGQRKPANINKFLNDVSVFTAMHYGVKCKSALMQLTGCSEGALDSEAECARTIVDWLSNGTDLTDNVLDNFLEKLDTFDLNEYIRSIHFDEIKVPTAPFQLPASKDYFHADGYMKAELAWLKATVLSHSAEPIIMYSDMPFEELSKDPEYPKKWMYGLAMLLKKGLRLLIIHNVDRSFYEMMLGLQGWIPLYMTGQVSPYYFKGMSDPVFKHFLRVSGEAAVGGEGVDGHFSDGRYHFCKSKDEVAYYRKRGEHILAKAQPLMDIYRRDTAGEFRNYFRRNIESDVKKIRAILPAPPLYTISEELLDRILTRNNVSPEDYREITEFAKMSREFFMKMLEKTAMSDEVYVPSREEFEEYPVVLSLADMFYEEDIVYTYDEYMEHVELTKKCAEENPSYSMDVNENQTFRHIQIRTAEGKWALISKDKSPAIHFVIKHPLLRQAIERMVVSSGTGAASNGGGVPTIFR